MSKESARQWQLALRKERARLGRCIDCGKRKEPGRSRCAHCLKLVAARQRKVRAKRRAEDRCLSCGRPETIGCCENCTQRMRERRLAERPQR